MKNQRKRGLVAILMIISMIVMGFSNISGNVKNVLATEIMSPNAINYSALQNGDVLGNGVTITNCEDSSGNVYSFLYVDENGNYLDGQRSATVTCPEKQIVGYQTKWNFIGWNHQDYYKNLWVIYQTGEFVSEDGSKINLYIQFDQAGIINIANRKIDQLDNKIITTGDTASIDYNGITYSCKTEDIKYLLPNEQPNMSFLKTPAILQRISTPIQYSVNYEAGGGTGTMQPSVYTYDQSTNLSANTFTRRGYTFSNWKDNTTGITYVDAQSVTNLSAVSGSAITLTAQWNQVSQGGNNNSGGGGGNTSNDNKPNEVNPIEKITQETITQIKDAKVGDTVKIDLSNNSVLPAGILNAIQGKDITIELDMGNNIKWILNGLSITGTDYKDINFGVSLNSTGVPVKIINLVNGKESYMQVQLLHEGEFGFKAVLEMNLNKENKNLMANLFYYDPQKDNLTLQSAGKIDAKGNVRLTFEHASDYVIMLAKTMLVTEDLKQVKVTPKSKKLKIKKHVQVTYALPESLIKLTKDSNVLTVTYKSSNKKVATVSSTGKVTAKKVGKTVISTTINVGGAKKTFKTVINVKNIRK